jgi:hypothetical protein
MLELFLPGVCNQTHLWMRRQKPVSQRANPLCRLAPTSGEYSNFPGFVKYL